MSQTPEERRAKNRAHAKARRDKVRAQEALDPVLKATNAVQRKAYHDAYYVKNREKLIAKQQAYYQEHHEDVKASARQRHKEHPEIKAASDRAYYLKQQEKRRAEREANPPISPSPEEKKARKRAEGRRYRLKNAASLKARKQASYQKNRAAILARQRERNALYPEQKRARERIYRLARLDKKREQDRAWKQANPARVRESNDRRRAQKKNAPINDLSEAQWVEIQAVQHHRCAYCGKRCKDTLTREHVTPYTRQGSNTLWNVVGACQSCNSRKNIGPPLSPVQPLLLTTVPSRKKKAS